MNIEAAILSLVVGLIRHGRISNLIRIPFRGAYAFAIPLALFAIASYLTHHTSDPSLAVLGTRATNILQYLVLLTAIGLNLHIREMKIMGIGAFSNFLTLAVNGGVMPISLWAARASGVYPFLARTKLVRHAIMTPDSRLRPLTDIIPVPGFHTVLSLGDVVLAVGIFMLIQRFMFMPSSGAHVEKTD